MSNPIGIFILIALIGFGLIHFMMGLLFPDDCDREERHTEVINEKHKKEFNL